MTDVPAVFAIDGVIRPYAWGSRTAIPQLLGVPAGDGPAAELWLGAHPDDPSGVPARDSTLDALIDADPDALLGAATAAEFGGRLPFLLKVLAAETALSIQVHPNLEQARAGFAAEEARGVPRSAPERNYKDANHKPELLCALTEFDALCGFRPVDATLRLFAALDVAELSPFGELLAGPDGLRNAFSGLLALDDPSALIGAVVEGARVLAKGAGEWADEARWVVRLAEQYPGDIGAVLSLLLNLVRLAAGEAIFLAAGNVHAYLHGTGVEVLANSDNVLRCGLTPKHVDVQELLRITDFRSLAEPRCPARRDGFSVDFEIPVPDFGLSIIDLDAYKGSVAVGDQGPVIVLAVDAPAQVTADGASVELARGHAAFVTAREAAFTVRGTGRIFCAETGRKI